ncbi:MAG: putative Ig domain-containing protein [Fimbriimonadaceae bacterium]|nr:putative Ig domain-containing protein [Fimbriimonadaceae bacterium]
MSNVLTKALSVIAAGFGLCSGLLAQPWTQEAHLTPPGPDLTGFTQWSGNGHWYKAVVVPGGITQPTAKAAAEAMGGHLATLTSAAENDFVFGLIDSPPYWNHLANGVGPWIGARSASSPAYSWAWLSGEPWTYTNWMSGQPDNTDQTAVAFATHITGVRMNAWDNVSPDNTGGITPPVISYVVEASSENGVPSGYGWAVDIDGDRAVVTAPFFGLNPPSELSGAAYIFDRINGQWQYSATLRDPDGDNFGTSVSLDGDRVLIGSYGAGDSNRGFAFIFERNQTGQWEKVAKLDPAGGGSDRQVGRFVALSGDDAVICSTSYGRTYHFRRSALGVWEEMGAYEPFGLSIAIDGSQMAIGLPNTIRIYQRSVNDWVQSAELTSPTSGFGTSVALKGGLLAVGAADAARGFVYTGSGAAWMQVADLSGAVGSGMGNSCAISDDHVVFGARSYDNNRGAAYVFTALGGIWTQQSVLQSATPTLGRYFGGSVAASGTAILVGEPATTAGLPAIQGTATVFRHEYINVAPILDPIGNKTGSELAEISFDANASDDPSQTLTYSLIDAPTGASINAGTGVFTWTPTEEQGPGDYAFTVRVSDNGDPALSDEEQITVHVNEANQAPVLNDPANQTVDEGSLATTNLSASDADLPAQPLTYSLVSGPGAVVGNTWSWTPGETHGGITHTVTVQVSDGLATAQQSFEVTVNEVNQAPVLNPIGNRTVSEQTLLTFAATASDPDLPGNVLVYTLDGAPAGASIGLFSGVFTWTPAETQGPGDYTFTIRVTDNGNPNLSDEETISVHVDEANIAPTLQGIGNKTADEGSGLTFTAIATDPDLPAQSLTFSLVGAPAGAAIHPTSGVLNWTPTEAQGPGAFTFTVRVTDSGTPTLFDEEEITVTVNEVNEPPVLGGIGNQTVDEMTLMSVTATASDPDLPGQALTFSLGTAPSGASINPTTGLISWTPSEADGPNPFNFEVIVSDGTATDTESFVVTVTEVNRPPVLTPPGDQTLAETATLSVQLAATDPDLPANGLTFEKVSGPASLTVSPSGLVQWSPTESDGPSTVPVTVRVWDDGNPILSDTRTFQVTVTEANLPPAIVAIPNQIIDEEAAFSYQIVASDPDLPGQTLTYYVAPGAPAGLTVDPQSGVLSWTPTESQGVGIYSVTVGVQDGLGGVDEKSFQITVREVVKTISGRIELQDYLGDITGQPITIELRIPGQPVALFVRTVNLTATGSFQFTATSNAVPAGTYDIAVKGSHWLKRLMPSVAIAANGRSGIDFGGALSLINGDADGDNEVAIGDFAVISAAYGSAIGDPNWLASADLDGDLEVSIGDYAILSANYGLAGD